MKALTIIQPWASAIADGYKRYETRSWSTAYRGPLAIHAGKRLVSDGNESTRLAIKYNIRGGPYGCIVAVADLVAVHPAHRMPYLDEAELDFGDFGSGRYAWELANVRPLAVPYPIRGAQGLWNVPDDVTAQIEHVLAALAVPA